MANQTDFVSLQNDEYLDYLRANVGKSFEMESSGSIVDNQLKEFYLGNPEAIFALYQKAGLFKDSYAEHIKDNPELEKYLKFYNENTEAIDMLFSKMLKLKKFMQAKTKDLRSNIDLSEFRKHFVYKESCYNPAVEVYLYSSFYVDIEKGNNRVLTLEAYVDVTGWHLVYFIRKGGFNAEEALVSELERLEIKFERRTKVDTPDIMFAINDYPYNATFTELEDGIFQAMYNAVKINL